MSRNLAYCQSHIGELPVDLDGRSNRRCHLVLDARSSYSHRVEEVPALCTRRSAREMAKEFIKAQKSIGFLKPRSPTLLTRGLDEVFHVRSNQFEQKD